MIRNSAHAVSRGDLKARWLGPPTYGTTPMAEKEPEQKSDGKGLFIIRNGRKVAKYEDGKMGAVTSWSRRSRHTRRH